MTGLVKIVADFLGVLVTAALEGATVVDIRPASGYGRLPVWQARSAQPGEDEAGDRRRVGAGGGRNGCGDEVAAACQAGAT